MASESSGDYSQIERLVEEFAQRYRQGERPSVKEYLDRYPHLADDLRALLPAQAEIEQVKEDAAPFAPPAPPLRQLGDYQILREIGKGGMGVVYEAEQLALGRRVALKVMPQGALPDAKAKRRFEREAKAAAKLHHTNIVPVFGVGEQDGTPYYVMQFIQGQALDAVIDELRRLQRGGGQVTQPGDVVRSLLTGEFRPAPDLTSPAPPAEPGASDPGAPSSSSVVLPGSGKASFWQSVARVGVQVAGALEYAHKQGILHRDIKPSNLLLDTQGTVWVTDFGLAKAEGAENLTRTGDVLGTLRYMPPEAFDGRSDPRGDIYSLGHTLYELLALRPAFDEKERNKLVKQVTTAEPVPLGRVNRAVPRDLVTVVHKAIERDPSHRYATAAELAADLQRFLDDEPIRARRLSSAERVGRWCRRNPLVAGLGAMVAVTLVGGTAVSTFFAVEARNQAAEVRRAAEEVTRERDHGRRLLYTAHLNLVRTAWQEGDAFRLRTLLDSQRPEQTLNVDLRGLEWFYWDRLSRSELYTLKGPGRRNPGILACSPDGRLLAAASEEEGQPAEVLVWDLVAGEAPGALPRGKHPLVRVYFREAGQALFTVANVLPHGLDWDESPTAFEVVAWDPTTRRERRRHSVPLPADWADERVLADVSPDGRRLAACGGGHVKVWDVETGKEVLDLHDTGKEVHRVAFSPDGRLLASGSNFDTHGQPGKLNVWDAITGRELFTSPPRRHGVVALAFSPDGRRLATGGSGRGELSVWDVATGKELVALTGLTGYVSWLAFSPDGRRVASDAGTHNGIRVWDAATGADLLSLPLVPDRFGFTFNADGRYLLTAGLKGDIQVWDAVAGAEARSLNASRSHADQVAWSPDGRLLATRGDDFIQETRVWDARTGERLQAFPARSNLAFCPDGRLVTFGKTDDGDDQGLRFWDVSSGKDFCIQQPEYDPKVAFSPDGRLLASAKHDGKVRLWDTTTGQARGQYEGHTGTVGALSFSPDGRRLVSGGHDKTVTVWDLADGRPLWTSRDHGLGVRAALFSPDGRYVASLDWDGLVELYDALTGEGRRGFHTFQGGNEGRLLFTPDSRRLVMPQRDRVRCWDVATGQEVLSLADAAGPKNFLAVSPDGLQLAAANVDGTVTVWDARPLTPERQTEREALSLLAHLHGQGLSRAKVGRRLGEDATLREAVRKEAQALADGYGRGVAYQEALPLLRDLAERVSSGAEFLAAIQKDTTLSADGRQEALALAETTWQSRLRQRADRIVRDLFEKHLVREEILAALRDDKALGEDLRREALARAAVRKPDASTLNSVSWDVVRRADGTAERYRQALGVAEAAHRLAPEDLAILNTLGVAQYRVGQYKEAAETLARCDRLRKESIPEDLAFLAMAQHRLGQAEPARATLERLRVLLRRPAHAKDEGNQAFAREAEALFLIAPPARQRE